MRSTDVKIFVNLETKERQYTASEEMCPMDGHVTFFNSCLVSGRLGKVTLGGGNKSGLFQVSLWGEWVERDLGAVGSFLELLPLRRGV